MAASVTINQSGLSAGVAGRARQDIKTGTAVTLSAAGGPFLSYKWSIRYRAIDILTGTRSSAVLSASTSATTSISPIEIPGDYAGRLLVDSGAGLGASPEDIFDWTFYAGIDGDPLYGAPAAGTDELPQRDPAFGERTEHNVPDAVDATGNVEGWARTMLGWFAVVRRLYARQLFTIAIVTNDGAAAALGREVGVSGAVRNSVGNVTVSFDSTFPDSDYAAIALPIGAVGGSAVVSTRSAGSCIVERGDPGGSLVDGDFVLLAMLRF